MGFEQGFSSNRDGTHGRSSRMQFFTRLACASIMTGANQEHGVLARQAEMDPDIARRFPVDTQLRILPNHACATAAQFSEYYVLDQIGSPSTWKRLRGW
jgi:D-serine deaminase-like pyridoxal phosphate-dependent protein